jgi:hypothetical protein
MAADDQIPPVLARRAHRTDQISIIAGGARHLRAVRGIMVVSAKGREEKIGVRLMDLDPVDSHETRGV